MIPPTEAGGEPAAEPTSWRVNPALPGLKIAGLVVFGLLIAVFADDAIRLALAVAGALALAVWAARDFIAPVRVAADSAGITIVTGYAGRRTLRWGEIERIRVDSRTRYGPRSDMLEIDSGDRPYFFSAYDLNAPPVEVAARLNQLRPES